MLAPEPSREVLGVRRLDEDAAAVLQSHGEPVRRRVAAGALGIRDGARAEQALEPRVKRVH